MTFPSQATRIIQACLFERGAKKSRRLAGFEITSKKRLGDRSFPRNHVLVLVPAVVFLIRAKGIDENLAIKR